MYRYEKVGLAAVCNLRPVIQGYIPVGSPRVHHLDIRVCGLYLLTQELRYGECDVLFVCSPVRTHRPCILSAMTCIYYDGPELQVSPGSCGWQGIHRPGQESRQKDGHNIFESFLHLVIFEISLIFAFCKISKKMLI